MRKLGIRRSSKAHSTECRSGCFAAAVISAVLLTGSAAASPADPVPLVTYVPEMAKIGRSPPPIDENPIWVVSPTLFATWQSGPPLIYPPAMAARGRWGFVDAECDIDSRGNATRCAIRGVFGGPAFGEAAKAYLLGGHYFPAMDHGVATPTTERFFIEFKLPGPERVDGPAFAHRSTDTFGYGNYVDISCRLDAAGNATQCHAFVADASDELEQAALNYVSAGRYRPMMRDGVPVSEDECLFHIPVDRSGLREDDR